MGLVRKRQQSLTTPKQSSVFSLNDWRGGVESLAVSNSNLAHQRIPTSYLVLAHLAQH